MGCTCAAPYYIIYIIRAAQCQVQLSLPVPCPLCPPNWNTPFHNTQVYRIFPPVFLCLPSPHAWFCSWTAFSPKKIYCTMPSSLCVQRIARKALVTSALATPDVAPVFASVVPAKTLKKRKKLRPHYYSGGLHFLTRKDGPAHYYY